MSIQTHTVHSRVPQALFTTFILYITTTLDHTLLMP